MNAANAFDFSGLPPAMTALLPEDPFSTLAGILVVVAVYGVFGIVCAVMAPGRGRSPVAWFFIGVATQCLGIILLLLLPNLKLEEEKQRRRNEETRRLREQLKKERQIADERHEGHRARLGAHDRALGLDTSSAESPPLLAAAPPPLPAGAAGQPEPLWFYAQGNQQLGPVPASMLRTMWLEQRIDDRALVWREGMANWTPLSDVKDLLEDRSA